MYIVMLFSEANFSEVVGFDFYNALSYLPLVVHLVFASQGHDDKKTSSFPPLSQPSSLVDTGKLSFWNFEINEAKNMMNINEFVMNAKITQETTSFI